MKSILLSGTAAVLLLTASGVFAAQSDDHQGNHQDTHAGGDADTHAGGDTHMSGPADNHNTMSGDHGTANGTTKTHTTTHRTRRTTTHTTSTTHDNDNHANNGFDHNGSNDNTHGNNGTTHPHATIDARIRITVNATHHFHAPAYRAPQGYVYRRYAVGERLEPAFYARDYWLTDYATYDLIAPPEGYTWVRFGPDAILIEEDTGETVQVQYGVFD